jgi:protein PhnA
MYICPECAHEWSAQTDTASEPAAKIYRDCAGNVLHDGDTVTVIKDLKLKGGGGVVKMGTKVKNIRLVDADHDIDCKIDIRRHEPQDGIRQKGLTHASFTVRLHSV